MTTHSPRLQSPAPRVRGGRARPGLARKFVGGFYLCMGGVHIGLVAADPQVYGSFADRALFPFVETAWNSIFMAHPALWGLALAAAEVALGVLLLSGGPWAKLGWAGVIAFHVALMVFGWGIWLWCVPALSVLVLAARRDWPRLSRAATHMSPSA